MHEASKSDACSIDGPIPMHIQSELSALSQFKKNQKELGWKNRCGGIQGTCCMEWRRKKWWVSSYEIAYENME